MLTPSVSDGSGATYAATFSPGGDENLDRVGQVELALHVLRLELLERRPERVAPEDVDRGVHLADRKLLGRRVGGFDDAHHGRLAVTDDAAVPARVGGLGAEQRRGGALPAVLGHELEQQLRREQRRVAREHEHVAGVAGERLARGANRVAGAERALLDRDDDGALGELVLRDGRGDDDERRRARLAPALDHPVDHAPAQDRVEVLGHRALHAGAEASGHHDCCKRRLCHVGSLSLMAGAPGFEPGIAGPKPAALPLGYAPLAASIGAAVRATDAR